MKFTRSQILAARKAWAEYLMEPDRLKGTGVLDSGDGHRCCLGHGCFFFNLPQYIAEDEIYYGEKHEKFEAPPELVELIGLWNPWGGTLDQDGYLEFEKDYLGNLAIINDRTDATPQEIGKYLMTVLEGGETTPFRPLTDYPEQIKD